MRCAPSAYSGARCGSLRLGDAAHQSWHRLREAERPETGQRTRRRSMQSALLSLQTGKQVGSWEVGELCIWMRQPTARWGLDRRGP